MRDNKFSFKLQEEEILIEERTTTDYYSKYNLIYFIYKHIIFNNLNYLKTEQKQNKEIMLIDQTTVELADAGMEGLDNCLLSRGIGKPVATLPLDFF